MLFGSQAFNYTLIQLPVLFSAARELARSKKKMRRKFRILEFRASKAKQSKNNCNSQL